MAKVVQLVQLAGSCWTKNMESGLSKCQLRNTGEKGNPELISNGREDHRKDLAGFFSSLLSIPSVYP